MTSSVNSISLTASAIQLPTPQLNVHGVYVTGNAVNTTNNNVTQLCISCGPSVG